MLKTKTFGTPLSVPMEPELRQRIMKLKSEHGADHMEWVRNLLREELPKVELELQKKKQSA